MAGFSNYLESAMLNHVFGGSAYSAPSTLFFGLHVGGSSPDLEDASGIVEPSGGGYARAGVANTSANFTDATQNGADEAETQNATAISFPQATASWGTATHWFISDSASGGNILAVGQLSTPKVMETGDSASFGVGTLVIALD